MQQSWGESPPTIKALTLRLGHLKKLAREQDPSNPIFKSKTGATSVKKEEGYVTPASSPKSSVKTPKSSGKKRDVEEVADVKETPRRTRRKVKDVKYVEPDSEEEKELFVKSDGMSDDEEEEEWKPSKVESDVEDAVEEPAVDEPAAEEPAAESDESEKDVPRATSKGTDVDDATEERVTDEIKGASNVLQENMNKANFDVVV